MAEMPQSPSPKESLNEIAQGILVAGRSANQLIMNLMVAHYQEFMNQYELVLIEAEDARVPDQAP